MVAKLWAGLVSFGLLACASTAALRPLARHVARIPSISAAATRTRALEGRKALGVLERRPQPLASRLRSVAIRATAEDAEEEVDQDQLYARSLAEDVMNEQGVPLDQLMNPMKAIRLYKELSEKTQELETSTGEARETLQMEIQETTAKLNIEKRSVMREELKTVFLVQSLLSIVVSGLLATNHFPGYPDLPIAAQALGFWTIWLFTIPSLRARKPYEVEKQALNVAFLATPLLNLAIPSFAKDPGLIWAANVAAIVLSYAWAFTFVDESEAAEAGLKIGGMARWLDWGTGRERGAPKEVREELERLEREQREQQQS
mmetsp:Transcript_23213/g.46606  ORF Transcript_23213/g.46606 Transcript_23213/m.46606 type:complete len:317 (-) Transcript_23213:148-1098(-)